jgi:hypothetical protein
MAIKITEDFMCLEIDGGDGVLVKGRVFATL